MAFQDLNYSVKIDNSNSSNNNDSNNSTIWLDILRLLSWLRKDMKLQVFTYVMKKTEQYSSLGLDMLKLMS